MSYNIDIVHDFGNLPFAADNTNADNRGKFVTIQSTGQVAVAAAGSRPHGVLRAGVTTGFSPAVTMGGFPYVLAEEALSFGDYVAVGANGGAAVATTGDTIVGVVVQEGAADTFEARIKFFDGANTAV